MALAPGLSRKLKKVLETRTDTPDLVASLNTLSTFYTENTPLSRRNLRSTIEKRSLSINEEFLLSSTAAQKALDRVEEEVNSIVECCDKIALALSSCNATTGDIISTTERLKQEFEITTQRQEIVSCFLRDYQLSPEEINALREEDLDENFFKALAHVQEIHANCKVLLRTHHQRAGLELMDMMAMYQEGAYERLCRLLFSGQWTLELRQFRMSYSRVTISSHLSAYRKDLSFVLMSATSKHYSYLVKCILCGRVFRHPSFGEQFVSCIIYLCPSAPCITIYSMPHATIPRHGCKFSFL